MAAGVTACGLVKVEDGGGGGRASHLRSPELFGDEVDDALLGLEGFR